MHEGLRQVAAQLALSDVVLFAEQPRWPAGGPVAFEPSGGRDGVALLVGGQRKEPAEVTEAAQEKLAGLSTAHLEELRRLAMLVNMVVDPAVTAPQAP